MLTQSAGDAFGALGREFLSSIPVEITDRAVPWTGTACHLLSPDVVAQRAQIPFFSSVSVPLELRPLSLGTRVRVLTSVG